MRHNAHVPTAVCNHGFWLAHCKLCAPMPGECDYGNCTEAACVDSPTLNAIGRVCEVRSLCFTHGARAGGTLRAAAVA